MRIHIATALVQREDRILLVASRYPNHDQPLWNLPGGRQQPRELLEQTVLRELAEETAMAGTIRGLAYVSESYDAETHFTNFTFHVDAQGEPQIPADQTDHVAAAAWLHKSDLAARIAVGVVREPLLAFLRDESARYAGYPDAGVSIVFPDAHH